MTDMDYKECLKTFVYLHFIQENLLKYVHV